MPGDNKKSFLDWLVQGAQDARDAKVGAVGAGTVRQLYNEGKSEEAQEMAKNLAIQQGTALVNFIPAGFAANKGLPWVMTNMALPVLGGEVVNEGTRKVSNNKYNSFGDFVYNGSKLANVANGTFMETPLRFIADMTNPGYWAPYGKAAGYTIDGLKSLTNAYNNLPVKIKFSPRENFRYRNIGEKDGLNDLVESGIVHRLNLEKSYKYPYFGDRGKLVQTEGYNGKYFLGAEDIGNNFRRPKSTEGLVPINELTINDVTINRRIFPKLTNSPYIEWAPGKYTEYNTPLKILQKNGFLTSKQYFNKTKTNVVNYLLASDGKWLDKPVFGMNFVMNRRLSKKELDRIWHDVHIYNEKQKAKYGYYNDFIPFRKGVVRVPTWREQLNNIISNTPSNVGPMRAGAINKNGEITLFAESLFRPNIKGTIAHEYRHDIQRGFSGLNLPSDIYHSSKYSQLQIPTTVRPASEFEALFRFNENQNLKNAQKLLGNTNKADNWFKELTEFDAELANLREKYKVNLPWTELPNNVRNKMIKRLSKRFGISPEDVNSIATDLANYAYKNGGKLCKKQ